MFMATAPPRLEPTTTSGFPVEFGLGDGDGGVEIVVGQGWIEDFVTVVALGTSVSRRPGSNASRGGRGFSRSPPIRGGFLEMPSWTLQML